MDDKTTTDAPVADGGSTINGIPVDDQGQAIPIDESQPDSTEPAEAVQETTEEPEQEPEAAPEPVETPSEDQEQEQLNKFAKSKGLTLDSENAIKAAKMAMNAEKRMHEKSVKASELEKVIDQGITKEAQDMGLNDDDRLDIARIKTKLTVREFFESNPDAKPFEQAMIQELSNKPHLAGDLESLYASAVMRSGGLDSVRSQAKRETLESLAHKQTAAVPKGNAVTSAMTNQSAITPQNVDQMVANMSVEEYRRRLPEINAAMAG